MITTDQELEAQAAIERLERARQRQQARDVIRATMVPVAEILAEAADIERQIEEEDQRERQAEEQAQRDVAIRLEAERNRIKTEATAKIVTAFAAFEAVLDQLVAAGQQVEDAADGLTRATSSYDSNAYGYGRNVRNAMVEAFAWRWAEQLGLPVETWCAASRAERGQLLRRHSIPV